MEIPHGQRKKEELPENLLESIEAIVEEFTNISLPESFTDLFNSIKSENAEHGRCLLAYHRSLGKEEAKYEQKEGADPSLLNSMAEVKDLYHLVRPLKDLGGDCRISNRQRTIEILKNAIESCMSFMEKLKREASNSDRSQFGTLCVNISLCIYQLQTEEGIYTQKGLVEKEIAEMVCSIDK